MYDARDPIVIERRYSNNLRRERRKKREKKKENLISEIHTEFIHFIESTPYGHARVTQASRHYV